MFHCGSNYAVVVSIFLDNHSTTRLDPRVLKAMMPWLTDHYGNAGSTTHAMGRDARDVVELSRDTIASVVGASAREIVFTSGATESNNLAILGTASRHADGGHLVTIETEHPAVLDPFDHLERKGYAVTRLPVERMTGLLDSAVLKTVLQAETFLVSISLANNEIGTIQDIPSLAGIVHDCGAVLHVDCAQAVGRVPLNMDALGIDLASFSAHKFHGPKGVGSLYVRRRDRPVRVDPLVYGGGQERGMRSGTLNIPSIVGMAEAARLAQHHGESESFIIGKQRNRLWEFLERDIPDIAINGPSLSNEATRLPNNLNVHIPGVDGQTLLSTLANEGLAISAGSACSSENPRPSHVLQAIGLSEDEARSSLRFGLSRFTSDQDIKQAAALVAAGVKKLRCL
ncbi:MAG: cysteine desulfurase family protein [Pirellulales bacterium]